MTKEAIIFGFIGVIIGGLITLVVVSNQAGISKTQESPSPSPLIIQHGTSMEDMVSNLKSKTGDDFDKEFIKSMIEHHEGAINMANEAKINAGHEEIKKMADDIISAQSAEITQMKQWQKDWGFK